MSGFSSLLHLDLTFRPLYPLRFRNPTPLRWRPVGATELNVGKHVLSGGIARINHRAKLGKYSFPGITWGVRSGAKVKTTLNFRFRFALTLGLKETGL